MKCDKEGYSKAHAEKMKHNIYTYSKRNKKLRTYFCPDCHMYHLTSAVGIEKWED